MTVLDPMFDLGGASAAGPMTMPDPRRARTGDEVATPFESTGMNGHFLADFLSAMATHERCGTHLYRSLAQRSLNPVLKARYREFGEETLHHVEVLTRMLSVIGGDAGYVSPMARGVEKSDAGLLESTYLLAGSLDPMAQEALMLDAVLVAETIDNTNWTTLGQIAEAMPEGPIRSAVADAVAEVAPQEDHHLEWAREMKSTMALAQARSSMLTDLGKGAETIAARVRDLFSDLPGT